MCMQRVSHKLWQSYPYSTPHPYRSRHLHWHQSIDDEVQDGNKDDNVESSRRSTHKSL